MYRTVLGDTWDTIAKEVYGDEKAAGWLMKNNPRQLGTAVFMDEVYIYTPPIPKISNGDLPDWRN